MDLSSAFAMAMIRGMYGIANFTAAYLIYRAGTPEAGLRINAIMGSIGPFFFAAVALIGIAGAASNLQAHKLIMLIIGITLIMLGTR